MEPTQRRRQFVCFAVLLLIAPAVASAGDWYRWRGPEQNGVSREKNLPDKWDADTGENVLWKAPAGGMSSPIVMKGKVFTLTRTGDVPSPDGDVIPGPKTQEALVCINAEDGKVLWQHAENMYETDLPFHRLGWSNPAGDPETNRVYALGAQCALYCLDADSGKEVWKRQMTADFGMISTFGGRTPTPAIDEDQLFVAGVAFGWGDNARSQYRVFCFDKNTGELRWTTGTGGIPVDAPYQTPVITVINGERLVITGGGDGTVTAFQARTGKLAWTHKISKRGFNASVVVDDQGHVYACHSEENLKGNRMGAVVCIDASGGKPKELWRLEGVEVGFSSPAIYDGILYAVDNSARVHAIDARTGKEKWKKGVGTIGKASVVYADGKLYIPEANGRITVLKVGDKADVVSRTDVPEKLGREYAAFGSVAIADGRLYVGTATTLYCIGAKEAKAESEPVPEPPKEEPVAQGAKPALIQVLPADAVVRQGQSTKFRARAFDDKGRLIGDVPDAEWSIGTLTFEAPPRALPVAPANRDAPPGGQPQAAATPKAERANAGEPGARGAAGDAKPQAPGGGGAAAAAAPPQGEKIQIGNLYGDLGKDGTYKAPTFQGPGESKALLGGAVVAKAGDVSGYARLRVVPEFPWRMGFTNVSVDRPPLTWIGAGGKFAVEALDANGQYRPVPPGAAAPAGNGPKLAGESGALVKLTNIDLYARARTYLGTSDMHDYTIQADVKVDAKQAAGRMQVPDVGIINSRYALMLYGNHQRAELHAWQPAAEYVTHQTIDYKWEPQKWYRLKLRVDQEGDQATVRGKVWPRDAQEPAEWTLQMKDPVPNRGGSPGLFGNSLVSPFPSFIYYDNILVADNKSENARADAQARE